MRVTVLNQQRGHRIAAAPLVGFLERVGRQVPPEEPASMAVALVSDRRMREYNRRYRRRDAATDVLSFPDDDGRPAPGGERYLGDVIIAVPTAARQARELGHSLAREVKLLALHGYLHLLGYDHERDDGTMLRLQRRVARRLLRRSPGGRAG